jgi:hypothetical protein
LIYVEFLIAVLRFQIRTSDFLGRYSTKWDWQRRPREEKKKERKIANNNEVHCTSVGKNTLQTFKQHQMGAKSEEV